MKKTLEVVGAIIVKDGRILAVKRGANKNLQVAYKYEFAGGKIEQGESKKEALIRELREEMSMEIEPIKEFCDVVYEYEDVFVHLYVFLCRALSDFVLKEHIDSKWLLQKELFDVEWAPADYDILKKLQKADFSQYGL